jgi:hypothetical protein
MSLTGENGKLLKIIVFDWQNVKVTSYVPYMQLDSYNALPQITSEFTLLLCYSRYREHFYEEYSVITHTKRKRHYDLPVPSKWPLSFSFSTQTLYAPFIFAFVLGPVNLFEM